MLPRLKRLLFQNSNARQTVVKNAFWLSFSQIVSRSVRALIIIYAARLLGTAEYGVFSYALGLAGFFTLFADLGLSAILTREATQKPEQASHYFSTAFWIKVVLLFFTALAIIFISPYFSKVEGAKAILPLVAFLVVFDNIREFSNAFFRAKEKMEYEAFVTLFMNVAIATFGFIVLGYIQTAQAVTASYVASTGLGMLAAIFVLREEFIHIVKHFRLELVRTIFTSAWSIAVIGLLGAFMLNTDILMLGWLTTASDIGLYSAGQRIVQVLYTLPSILASSIFPALSRSIINKDTVRTRNIMERAMTMVFFVALPLATGGIVLGNPIMRIVFGSEYMPGALTFQILMATILFVFPGTLIGNYILGHDRQGEVAKFVGFASLGNIIFNYLFIIPFGIAGAAAATIVVQIFYITFMWRFAKHMEDFHTFKHLKKIGLATLAMGIIAYVMNSAGIHVLITIPVSGLFYLGTLMALKEPVLIEALATLRSARHHS